MLLTVPRRAAVRLKQRSVASARRCVFCGGAVLRGPVCAVRPRIAACRRAALVSKAAVRRSDGLCQDETSSKLVYRHTSSNFAPASRGCRSLAVATCLCTLPMRCSRRLDRVSPHKFVPHLLGTGTGCATPSARSRSRAASTASSRC